jgi:membrane carboxypeptidase/penicillin-binding protein PbpC
MVLSINEAGKEPMVLPSLQPQVRSLLSPSLAFLVHDILTDEVSRRLAFGYPSPLSIGRPSAATIGFADQRSQSWTVGYTPERLVVTWVAAPPQAALDYRFSAGLWHALIQYATQPFPAHGWDQPAGIAQAIVCDPSGLLPTDDCPSLVSELFLEGNQPGTADTLYRKLSINRETGRLATVFTPLELIEEQIFLIVPPEAQAWAQSMDLPVPPDSYDAIQLPPPLPDTHITSPGIFTYVSGMVDIIGTASGSGFTNYRIQAGEGLNPQQWIQVGDAGQSRVRDGLLTQWDTTGLEGLYAVRLIVQRGTQEIETATIQVTVDNKPPEMTILAPQPADILQQNPAGEVTFQVRPEDNLGVAAVRWYINGKLAAERTQSPYTAFVALAPGNYLSTIEVIDLAGNATRSEDIFFTVE